MRLTIACPEAFIEAANHYAMCLGASEAERYTYGEPSWVDSEGNRYACASLEVSDSFIEAAFAPLTRPTWDTEDIVNLEAASTAQDIATLSVAASPAHIAVWINDNPIAALNNLGVSQVDAT